MKVKVQSDDASTLRKDGWSQMGDWLAQLRDDGRGEPPGDGHAGADGAGDPWQAALAQADVLAEARARTEARARAHAEARLRAEARGSRIPPQGPSTHPLHLTRNAPAIGGGTGR